MTERRRAVTAIAATVLAAALAGCGGSEPAPTTTVPAAAPSVGSGMVQVVDQAKDVSDLMDQRNAAINDQLP
jgi:hypothetical protein